MNSQLQTESLAVLIQKIDDALHLLMREQPLLDIEKKKVLEEGLVAGKTLGNDLKILSDINIKSVGGDFIKIADGKKRSDDYATMIDKLITGDLKDKLNIKNFGVDADKIRTLLDDTEGTKKAERLLIYPALNGTDFTLVFASANKTANGKDKVINTNQRGGLQVLDEIEPCKGKDCPTMQ